MVGTPALEPACSLPDTAFSSANRVRSSSLISAGICAVRARSLRCEGVALSCRPLRWQPMFVKYNLVCRAHGSPDSAYFVQQLEKLCGDNTYCTTLHVINSAVVKLGKLVRAQKVYRGVTGRILPPEFWQPNEFNVCGGVEFGFSTRYHTAQLRRVLTVMVLVGVNDALVV